MKGSQRILQVLPSSAPEASHNGILLPPFQTQWEGSKQVRRPISNEDFEKINKKRQDLVNVERTGNFGITSSDPVVRANQLEQNIRFLQEQHQIMLAGLHSEIETLRQRNRDLQFQIVFSKGGVALLQNSPNSSPEDEAQRKIMLSPSQVNNITPIQVELLERDVAELRTNLSESRTRNVYLQNIVDEQKKKLSALENEKLDLAAVGKKIGKENVTKPKSLGREETAEELNEKLEDADRLIRRLRRENEEQRKEIVSLRTTVSKAMAETRRSDGGNTHRNYYRNSQSQTSRFPPLHNHQQWKNNSSDYQPNRNPDRGGNRLDKESEVVGRPAPTLPHLRDRNNASTSTGYSNPAYNNYQGGNHKRGYHYYRKQDDHRPGNRTSRREQVYQPDKE